MKNKAADWILLVLGIRMQIFFVKTRSLKLYGKYFKWPVGVSGMHYVVKIQTGEDCVHLSNYSTFLLQGCYQDTRSFRQARFYRRRIEKYFTFPKNISKPVTNHDFGKIEKTTETSIWLYFAKKTTHPFILIV